MYLLDSYAASLDLIKKQTNSMFGTQKSKSRNISPNFLFSGSRRAERISKLLLAVIHRFLVWRDAEEDALDFLQNRAVELASRGDGREFAQEADGAREKVLEALLVDEFAHVGDAPGGGEDEHVSELPVDD